MGINTAAYKSLTFGMSGFYTGIAGALGAIVAEFVAPDSFTFFLAVWFLVGMVVGGLASIPAAIVGGLFIVYGQNFSEEVVINLFATTPAKSTHLGVLRGNPHFHRLRCPKWCRRSVAATVGASSPLMTRQASAEYHPKIKTV